MTALTLDDVQALARRALVGSGASDANAAPVADSMRHAEASGMRNHGLGYLPVYCDHLRLGKIDGRAAPSHRRTALAVVMSDAAHGFAHTAFAEALDDVVTLAHDAGTVSFGIARSYSAGAVDWFVEQFAARGLVSLAFANASPLMPAWGGKVARFGTNPIAFAAPVPDADPIVLDMATSATARVNVMAAARRGETLPAGWALDAGGEPTTDPTAALAGMVAPLGGHKGYGLALMVDVLAAALTGSNCGYEASGLLDNAGGPPGVGQLFVVFAPGAFGATGFERAVDRLADVVVSEPGVRLPGSGRFAQRRRAEREGVDVPDDLLARLEGYCS